jgi:hypothetical protein
MSSLAPVHAYAYAYAYAYACACETISSPLVFNLLHSMNADIQE